MVVTLEHVEFCKGEISTCRAILRKPINGDVRTVTCSSLH